MNAFHTIAIPHDDILEGRLTMDVFAADLWEVFNQRGAEEYRRPDLFFKKTYQTEGLSTLLQVVEARLQGKGGDAVLQLQTPFGGGKTHALIAMYHKAAEWGAKRVVMVGTAMSAHDTLWGMLEEQLRGKKEKFAGLTAPGRTDALRELLVAHSPLIIQIDELLEYVTKAAAVQVVESTLAAQTIAFLQEITEAVSTLDRVVLVITLPSSALEHFDEQAARLFQQLQRVSGRVEKIYTPVQDHEITQVIRRRLFASVDAEAASKQIDKFMEYAVHENLLPAGVEPSQYRQRFEASYPFLPEVVDVLYQRWGSFSSFQRTRGVLRLLALVVHSLKDTSLPYISLADFDLANQEIRRELSKHIGPEFDAVIAADITGPESGAKQVNQRLGKSYQGLRLGERVTTSIFMYSFSGGTERGLTLTEIKRNATTLQNPSSAVAEAVEELKGRLFYIQNQAGKYFFSNQINLNRMLLIRMENIPDEDVRQKEEDLLRAKINTDHFKVYIWCTKSANVADTPELKLIVLNERNETLMQQILEDKGESPRVYRNTLIFLLPLSSERPMFSNLVRKWLAYRALQSDSTVSLTAEQSREIASGLKKLEGELAEGIRRLYRKVCVPDRQGWKEFDLGIPTVGATQMIAQEVYERLRSEGEVLEKIAPPVIKEKYLKRLDYVATSQLYRASLSTPGEQRAVSRTGWELGIVEGVRQGIFGLGELQDEQAVCRYFREECSPSFDEKEVLIRAEICEAQRRAQAEAVTFPSHQPTVPGKPLGEASASTAATQPTFAAAVLPATKYQQLHLKFVVPKGKISDLMGVLNFLQKRYKQIEISLNVCEGQLTEQEFEEKIKEAFRQMGIDLEMDKE